MDTDCKPTCEKILRRLLVVIPAFNEESALGGLLAEIRVSLPGVPILVVSDGSKDDTAAVARAGGAAVLDLPHNLGVGGAMQAGFQFAVRHGFQYVLRVDGDGQHPPSEALRLVQCMCDAGPDLVIGSRFGIANECVSTRFRYLGIRVLAFFLSRICRARISDPTSGFWLVSRPLLDYFAVYYPTDYPEPEALALLRRHGYGFVETPVRFRERQAGISSIQFADTLYYMVKVGLALLVDRVRTVSPRHVKNTCAGSKT